MAGLGLESALLPNPAQVNERLRIIVIVPGMCALNACVTLISSGQRARNVRWEGTAISSCSAPIGSMMVPSAVSLLIFPCSRRLGSFCVWALMARSTISRASGSELVGMGSLLSIGPDPFNEDRGVSSGSSFPGPQPMRIAATIAPAAHMP